MLLLVLVPFSVQAQTATVNWTKVHQQMDGFGGQAWGSATSLTDKQADMFFSSSAGIGLEYVRTANTDNGSVPDLVTLQKAVARGAKIELSLQSPPASMKVSRSFTNGAGGIITGDYGAYATYIVNWINMLASHGVPVSVLSVQNEPDITSSSLGACIWTASQFDTFVGSHLGPALSAANLSPKVMIGEASTWFRNDLVDISLNDPNASQYISIIAGHGYGLGNTDGTGNGYCCNTASPHNTTKHVWQSEVNGGFSWNSGAGIWNWDPSIADGMVWAHNIHDYLTVANVSGWEYWELADCCGGPYNDGLTDSSLNPAKRMYVVGNWSKFVRSGYYRIDATANPQSGVYVSAFQDTQSGTVVIVAVNDRGSNVPQAFSIASGPNFTSATSWITSASLDLEEQSAPISLSANSFTYTLPASSVTTFVGLAGSNAVPLTAPTNLQAVVQ